ncbi:flagellar motor protein MotB [Sporanaerobium hydrogeniformans]|uniref:Flagellar motor protein MotB n=1 Tax=Sporanaerobium hydrogeniformans TaxID=3072179 RepID=A0AC61DEP1_9FIRM|nr:flagellar motor protein MotB [Sporanaerobium hydrogeniformans]PHV71749.1 flagellar motor protein MotB [Sporanaerobium hydrogeniformans]
MKKKEDEPKKGAPAYMNTYGDMMTLLLTFFVLLFSMSTVDVAKFKALVASFEGAAGILTGGETVQENTNMLGNGINQYPTKKKTNNSETDNNAKKDEGIQKLKESLQTYVDEKNLTNKVEIQQDGDEVIIRFDDILLFDSGKADIKPGAIPVLNTLGVKLQNYLSSGYRLRFEGHTDNRPIKTAQFKSNWYLSAARAIAVTEFFVNEMEFNPAHISTEGFGEHNPIATNNTPEGRAMNRRVEIKISKDNIENLEK